MEFVPKHPQANKDHTLSQNWETQYQTVNIFGSDHSVNPPSMLEY